MRLSSGTAARIVVPVALLAVALPLGAQVVGPTDESGTTLSNVAVTAAFVLFVLAFVSTGAVLAIRLPHNPIGWLFIAAALSWSLAASSMPLGELALRNDIPVASVFALVANFGWGLGIPLATTFPLLLFPSGTYGGAFWRWMGSIAAAAAVLFVLATIFRPGRIPDTPITNPIGLGSARAPFDTVSGATLVVVIAVTLVAVAGLILRFRRSDGEQRQQFKFLLYAALVVGVGLVLGGVIETQTVQSETSVNYTNALTTIVICAVPIGMAVAVLKYRLYDIDVVINRTLVYGALTALLAFVYVGLVFVFQRALAPVTAESDLAIAASTLAVAALFRPLRARVQAFIDRRFYRAKYDAQRTLDGFSARLRDEVDLDALTRELVGVAGRTVHPAHASLWLRGAAGGSR